MDDARCCGALLFRVKKRKTQHGCGVFVDKVAKKQTILYALRRPSNDTQPSDEEKRRGNLRNYRESGVLFLAVKSVASGAHFVGIARFPSVFSVFRQKNASPLDKGGGRC